MNLSEYTAFTRTTAIYPDANLGNTTELMYLALGLAGEAGEVANKIKKLYRDSHSEGSYAYYEKRKALEDELGDVLWYWARLCDALNRVPDNVIVANVTKLTRRQANGSLKGDGDNR